MSEGKAIYQQQMQFADSHIVVRFIGFDPSSGTARLAVDENHPNVGFYYIWVYFGSGDSTRIDYDGGNHNRDNRPIIRTNHKNDTVTKLEVKRVRD
jgi:hypothetical protein